MTEHRRFLELAAASLDFELTRAERDELAAHLATCGACTAALDGMRADAHTMRRLPIRALAVDRAPVILSGALGRRDLQALRLVALAAVLALLAVGLITVGSEILRDAREPVVQAPITSPETSQAPRPISSRPALAPFPPGWQAAATLVVPRTRHAATLLLDNQVMVAGGIDGTGVAIRSAETFDPVTGVLVVVAEMGEARSDHAALTLTNGVVLVFGGYGADGAPIPSAELYDGVRWTSGPTLQEARAEFAVAQLESGQVVVTGGFTAKGRAVASVEAFAQGNRGSPWSQLPRMATPRAQHTATTLPDGRILVTGGVGSDGVPVASTEIYDPLLGQWQSAEPMHQARALHTATVMPDGQVLVVGGLGAAGQTVGDSQFYDPTGGAWSKEAQLWDARKGHAAARVGGLVLVVGGTRDETALGSAETFDHATQWVTAAVLSEARSRPVMLAIPGAGAIVIGGDRPGTVAVGGVESFGPP